MAPAAGVARRVTTLPLQHSFATHLPERKVDIRVIPGAGRLQRHRFRLPGKVFLRTALVVQAVQGRILKRQAFAPLQVGLVGCSGVRAGVTPVTVQFTPDRARAGKRAASAQAAASLGGWTGGRADAVTHSLHRTNARTRKASCCTHRGQTTTTGCCRRLNN